MLIPNLKTTLQKTFPDAEISLSDYKHDGVHILLEISSEKFRGLTLIQQHRLVYESVKAYIESGELHALKIRTKIPENSKNS